MDWVEKIDRDAASAHATALTQRLLAGLEALSGVRVLGPSGTQARAPVVSFAVDGLHPHDICTVLDEHGVAVRGGHHCAQPLMDRFDLAGTTRASLAWYNTEADIDALLAGLDDAIHRLGGSR